MNDLHTEIAEWLATEREKLKHECLELALFIAVDYIKTRRTFPTCSIDSYDVRDGSIRIYYRRVLFIAGEYKDSLFTHGWQPLQP